VAHDLESDVHLSLVPPRASAEAAWESDEHALSSPVALANQMALEPMRVLIVDDAPSTRRFLRAVLEHCREFTVIGEASDGAAAIEQAGELHPDLVLLDLSMPTADGASALEGILRTTPDARVIVVSGMNPSVGGMMIDAGAIAFVPKGLSPFDLLDRLGNILGRSITVDNLAGLENADRSGSKAPSAMAIPAVSAHRAVVFEDDPTIRSLISQGLAGCDVSVVAETDAAATMLAVVDLAQPELVVLDVLQKGAPDTEIITEICRRSPHSVVIVYSKFEEWKDKALAAGAAAFVVKPRIDELIDRIRQLAPGP
jgi:DNA-binding NarL/FixJ family response regulator